MFLIIAGAVVAFITTELDDLLSMLVLFSRARNNSQRWAVVAGKYAGLVLLTAGSAFFAHYISKIPGYYIGFLGLIPVAIGIKEGVESLAHKKEEEKGEALLENKLQAAGFFALMLTTLVVTLADGGDNIAVYISYFSGKNIWDFLTVGIVFIVMQAVFCAAAWFFVKLPSVKKILEKTEAVLVPLLFILLGLWIMWENGSFAWLYGLMS